MRAETRKRFENMLWRHQCDRAALAQMIVHDLEYEFMQRYPESSLRVCFGNGRATVHIDGKSPSTAALPDFILSALNDIAEITDDFRNGCPLDIVVAARYRGGWLKNSPKARSWELFEDD